MASAYPLRFQEGLQTTPSGYNSSGRAWVSLIMKKSIDALSQAGFHLHLDDFGTGYSSLHRLQSLPFSTLKLDRSFVTQMGKGDDRIARVIISLASQMHMQVIAEGIETADQ